MNKLIVSLLALFVISSVAAMNVLTLTETENTFFVDSLYKTVIFGEQMIAENKISANNPIHSIHKQLSDKLTLYNNDLLQVIGEDQRLQFSIMQITEIIEKKDDVQDLKNKIFDQAQHTDCNKMPEITQIMEKLMKARWQHSKEILAILAPNYFQPDLNGKNDDEDNVNFSNFMLRNEQHPINKEAQEVYIMTIIYQYVFARRIPDDMFPMIFFPDDF